MNIHHVLPQCCSDKAHTADGLKDVSARKQEKASKAATAQRHKNKQHTPAAATTHASRFHLLNENKTKNK